MGRGQPPVVLFYHKRPDKRQRRLLGWIGGHAMPCATPIFDHLSPSLN
jgi:hypothetical protein